eukprot:TRINITY_DN15405_c0_g1_i2.p1 TRINITY_DN15405_c0_g1~~TRINITY_DN15405_c0_g1_i2.p1  ORF type:complete len:655 (+),score=162.80 TRINITY_DN15405_c0_g1_i2:95-2059(+)
MVIYYDPEQPVIAMATTLQNSAIKSAMMKPECILMVVIYIVLVVFRYEDVIPDHKRALPHPPWEAILVVNFFTSVLLAFYIKQCYNRYIRLYEGCMAIVDAVVLFVYELTISFGAQEWKEVLAKHLLTKQEIEALFNFPGDKVIGVLTNWSLQVIDDALRRDMFWRGKQQPVDALFGRINKHVMQLMGATERVGNLVGLPVPYQYHHMANFVIVSNFILMGWLLTEFELAATVVVYTMFVLVFLALREVGLQMADPFKGRSVDFPVAEFLNFTMSQCICLLETFSALDKQTFLSNIEEHDGFSNANLKFFHARAPKAVGLTKWDTKPDIKWEVKPMDKLEQGKKNILDHIRRNMRYRKAGKKTDEEEEEQHEHTLQEWLDERKEMQIKSAALKEEADQLQKEADRIQAHIARLEMIVSHDEVLGVSSQMDKTYEELQSILAGFERGRPQYKPPPRAGQNTMPHMRQYAQFCVKCDNEFLADAMWCRKCGTKRKKLEVVEEVEPEEREFEDTLFSVRQEMRQAREMQAAQTFKPRYPQEPWQVPPPAEVLMLIDEEVVEAPEVVVDSFAEDRARLRAARAMAREDMGASGPPPLPAAISRPTGPLGGLGLARQYSAEAAASRQPRDPSRTDSGAPSSPPSSARWFPPSEGRSSNP